MNFLVFEPQTATGVVVRWLVGTADKTTNKTTDKFVKHGDDLLAAVVKIIQNKRAVNIDGILVRIGIGSFSAGRAAAVVAVCLGWLRVVPVFFTEQSVRTIATAIVIARQQNQKKESRKNKNKFIYAAPPHITRARA